MPANLTEADAFTTPVTVPEDGDERNAASITPAFQALTDRTRNLRGRLDGLDAAPHTFTDAITFAAQTRLAPGVEITYPTPVARTRSLVMPPGGAWAAMDPGFGITAAAIQCGTPYAQATREVWLPHGSRITGLRVRWSQGSVAGDINQALWCRLLREKPDETGGVIDLAVLCTLNTANAPLFRSDIVTFSHVVDNASYYYLRLVASGTAGGTTDKFFSATLYYEESRLTIY